MYSTPLVKMKRICCFADNAVSMLLKQKKVLLFFQILGLMPTWILHQFSNQFLDCDLAFLHDQEKELELHHGSNNYGDTSSSFYMPTF